jgi:predicted metallo-beta-lactamase superfamily hydrolase
MVDKSRVKEMADKYIGRIKVSTDEAKKAFEKSMSELDQIGNEMYEDMRVNLKDSGFDIEKMQAKMKGELLKDRDELKKDFWRVESRLVKFGEDVEKEIRKTFKQD